MFRFLFWVKRFQIFIVGFAISIRNTRNFNSCTFLKEYAHVRSVISSSLIFVILSIAFLLKPGALK